MPFLNELPFPRANIWDCPALRTHNHGQLQLCYQNEVTPAAHATSKPSVPVRSLAHAHARCTGCQDSPAFFSINQDSQRLGRPLPAPFDPPAYKSCTRGPSRHGGKDYCITNVLVKPVSPGDNYKNTAPICWPGNVPSVVGHAWDNQSKRTWVSWQCLPPSRGVSK